MAAGKTSVWYVWKIYSKKRNDDFTVFVLSSSAFWQYRQRFTHHTMRRRSHPAKVTENLKRWQSWMGSCMSGWDNGWRRSHGHVFSHSRGILGALSRWHTNISTKTLFQFASNGFQPKRIYSQSFASVYLGRRTRYVFVHAQVAVKP